MCRIRARVCKNKRCKFCTGPSCGLCGNCLHPERKNKCIRRYVIDLIKYCRPSLVLVPMFFNVLCGIPYINCKKGHGLQCDHSYSVTVKYPFFRMCPLLNRKNRKASKVDADAAGDPANSCKRCGKVLFSKYTLQRHVSYLQVLCFAHGTLLVR
jgi:hypothetical protein